MNDREFYKFFAGLLGALAALTVVFFVLAQMVVSGSNLNKNTGADDAQEIAQRIKPVGELSVGATAVMNSIVPTANAAAADGAKVYQSTCSACHAAGVAGAPKFGDKAAWKDRIAQGNAKLYEHAIKGFQGKAGFMPPKGGNSALSDAEVKAAVDHMVSKAK
jgi:cytochrome c5